MAKTNVNDTPPSAIKNGGWISKLIDPAARLIVSTATHLFACSIFGKNTNSIQQIPQATSAPQITEQREDFVDIKLHFHYNGIIMTEQELSSRFNDIFELEHLIHQKCLTKDEIDCLYRLINSRIVEPGNYVLLQGNESKEKEAPSTPGLNAAVSPTVSPTGFVSTDMIRRPYCRSALCRRVSRSSCKDKNSDLIRPLKWRRPTQFDTSQFRHQQGLKRSRSDWNEECSDDEQRRVRQKTCLFQKSFSQFSHQQGLKRSRSDWNEECSDDEQRRVRKKTCSSQKSFSQFGHQHGLKRSRSDWNEEGSDDEQKRVCKKTCLSQKSFSQFGHQQGLKRSRTDWNEECSDDEQRRVRQKKC